MKKTEIRVTIDSVEKQQRAIEILKKYKQKIFNSKLAMIFDNQRNLLKCDYDINGGDWFITSNLYNSETEITLDELEEMLKNEKK